MPLRALRLQRIKRHRRTADTRAAHGKLRNHDGQTQDGQEYQLNQHERRATVLTRDIRETPNVAKADSTASRHQDKAQTGRKTSP